MMGHGGSNRNKQIGPQRGKCITVVNSSPTEDSRMSKSMPRICHWGPGPKGESGGGVLGEGAATPPTS